MSVPLTISRLTAIFPLIYSPLVERLQLPGCSWREYFWGPSVAGDRHRLRRSAWAHDTKTGQSCGTWGQVEGLTSFTHDATEAPPLRALVSQVKLADAFKRVGD